MRILRSTMSLNVINWTLPITDDFEKLYALSSSSKIIIYISGLCATTVWIISAYGIVWYVHYGSDQKYSLKNRFISLLCTYCLLFFCLVHIPFLLRGTFQRPLPKVVCLAALIYSNAFFLQVISVINIYY